ncbi:anti-sigma factor family protein [Planctomycetes bacterium K23_9]|uniref:Zinc-finger domain-containing protein n=1 Tax=Stieleria marina TaxID=1930275 RepID=A0A517P1B4_9BACT|nr:hypothetical protein K239x_51830 [Planctomycetes bacterium K23_9]
MPIPRELLDQLLSGYLDDVLSDDEKSRLEQLLNDDLDVAAELEDLRRIRGSLRQICRSDAGVRLDDGFAERVMGAAVAQASAEGLGEDHPLIKLAEHPNTPQLAKQMPIGKIAGALIALAASIAIGIVMLRPPQQPIGVMGGELAKASPQGEMNRSDELVAPEVVNPAIVNPATEIEPEALIAVADTVVDSLDPEIGLDPSKTGETVAVEKAPEPMRAGAATPSVDAIASSPANAESVEPLKSPKMPTEAEAAKLLGKSNVLTFLVKRTEQGRQSRTVRNALRGAGIKPVQEKTLSDGLVGAVSDSLEGDEQAATGTQLLYLELPAKKVDVFFDALVADKDGIESVGLKMIATPAERRIVRSLSPDAVRAIRHDQSWLLQGAVADQVANELASDKTFMPMRGTGRIPLTSMLDTDGPDQMSRLLILIQ